MLEGGATHLGVATDHVIESFRNDLWDDYKNGAGIDPSCCGQFPLLEDALDALGVAVWPMVEFEADDALASAAAVAAADRPRRAGDHLHARQGPRPVRGRQGRAARPAQARSCSTPTACARSSACRPSRSPTGSRSSATAPTASPASPASARSRRPRCSRASGTSRRSPTIPTAWDVAGVRGADRSRRRSRPGARWPTRFKVLATLRDRRATSAPSTTGSGAGPTRALGDWCERFGSPRLAERAAKLAARRGFAG